TVDAAGAAAALLAVAGRAVAGGVLQTVVPRTAGATALARVPGAVGVARIDSLSGVRSGEAKIAAGRRHEAAIAGVASFVAVGLGVSAEGATIELPGRALGVAHRLSARVGDGVELQAVLTRFGRADVA